MGHGVGGDGSRGHHHHCQRLDSVYGVRPPFGGQQRCRPVATVRAHQALPNYPSAAVSRPVQRHRQGCQRYSTASPMDGELATLLVILNRF